MSGFRIGYVAASREIIQAMTRFQGHTSGNVCTFAQCGALAAVMMNGDLAARQKASLKTKRDLAFHAISALFPCIRPEGAFYIFLNVRHLSQNSYELAFDILEKAGVGVAPGIDFGENAEGYIRISYANSLENISEGLDRIGAYLKSR